MCDPISAWTYFKLFLNNSVPVTNISGLIEKKRPVPIIYAKQRVDVELESLEKCELPLTKHGKGIEVPDRSGLNWGQRDKRNHDQTYLSVPAEIAKSGFFPKRGARFLLHTVDGQHFECAIAQDGDKAIHTVEDNSLFGSYFRGLLGVPSGSLVSIEHLRKYGRDSVTIYKLPQGDYLLDFRVK